MIKSCDLCTITLFLSHTPPHRKTNYSFSKSQSLPEELSLSLSSPSLSSAPLSSVVSSSSSSISVCSCSLLCMISLHSSDSAHLGEPVGGSLSTGSPLRAFVRFHLLFVAFSVFSLRCSGKLQEFCSCILGA